MKYYKISTWSPYIVEVDVEKETDKFVYIKGSREAKSSGWGSGYAPTWEKAVEHLQSYFQGKVDDAQKQVDYCQEKLDDFKEEIASQP
jgi:hypothetical protein